MFGGIHAVLALLFFLPLFVLEPIDTDDKQTAVKMLHGSVFVLMSYTLFSKEAYRMSSLYHFCMAVFSVLTFTSPLAPTMDNTKWLDAADHSTVACSGWFAAHIFVVLALLAPKIGTGSFSKNLRLTALLAQGVVGSVWTTLITSDVYTTNDDLVVPPAHLGSQVAVSQAAPVIFMMALVVVADDHDIAGTLVKKLLA
jgi:hypothetical protein